MNAKQSWSEAAVAKSGTEWKGASHIDARFDEIDIRCQIREDGLNQRAVPFASTSCE
ncbi:hypothetical protein DY000_02026072 [Brassica cretica]|uniref:Uncharacterized protein n=1 Tax=Brassica cretica TaxID=69181 RepID=A0ABQ7E4R0_BRACR|nr:hypothetical protein DY000_02026072 [Brassica cretica]